MNRQEKVGATLVLRRPLWFVLGSIAVMLQVGQVGAALSNAELPWSISPVRTILPPGSAAGEPVWGHNVIDQFVHHSLRGRNLSPAPPADRSSLIRRATYDLTGLPPSPERVEEFVTDPRPTAKAFEIEMERLMASSHYGERFGRHWLDVVRYADTAGENSDHPLPHAWKYRNWVIDAFNEDMPYDEFVKHQIAGDLLTREVVGDEQTAGIIATGYLAIARRYGHDIDKQMYLTYEDAIDNFGKTFLGLTVACARCHDHKHDPITARDYYSLYAILDSTKFSFPGCEPKQQPRDLVPLVSGGLAELRSAWQEKRKQLSAVANPAELDQLGRKIAKASGSVGRVLSEGKVPDAGAIEVAPEPIRITVRKGEVVQLSILPNGNYGADTTILEYALTHGVGEMEQRWSVMDFLDNLLESNPHDSNGATWCFLDTSDPELPRLLSHRESAVQGKMELNQWSVGVPPTVLVNRSEGPVSVWTTLPPRTFFVHPGSKGPVALTWLSPVDGEVEIELMVKDGHPGGDGVGWKLEHFRDASIGSIYSAMGEVNARRMQALEDLREHDAKEPKVELAYAVSEGEPKRARVHRRGDYEDQGEPFERRFLEVLGGGRLGDTESSGRLALAEAVADEGNPLTARVMVNRVWGWHFGQGLVSTPNDFGNHGAKPSHPELLDYLTRYFVESGWSVKALNRLIMRSATYQQAASEKANHEALNGFVRRRLTAEELRDTLLMAAGRLDSEPGQGHPFPVESKWNFSQHAPFAAEYETRKRSIYVMRKRNRSTRFFALFNGADPNASTAVRDVTTVPTQALYFMNDPFVDSCAEAFAKRIVSSGNDDIARLRFACRLLFSREPDENERRAFEQFRERYSATLTGDAGKRDTMVWASYARVLLASNELIHID